MTDPVPSKDLCSQLRALPAGFRLLGYTAAEKIERLQAALRGIASCSTCEACRGAATLALNGANTFTCIGNCGASVPGPHAYCSACFLKARRPAHEREPPHCSNCSCGFAPEPNPVTDAAIAQARRIVEQWPAQVRAAVCTPEPAAEPVRAWMRLFEDGTWDVTHATWKWRQSDRSDAKQWTVLPLYGPAQPPGEGQG